MSSLRALEFVIALLPHSQVELQPSDSHSSAGLSRIVGCLVLLFDTHHVFHANNACTAMYYVNIIYPRSTLLVLAIALVVMIRPATAPNRKALRDTLKIG